MGDLQEMFDAVGRGDAGAMDRLFSFLYRDLRQLAHARLRHSAPLTLLDTTALVHESYLRLCTAANLQIPDRGRFLGYAARVMRSIIVDLIRQRESERRGGDVVYVTLDPDIAPAGRMEERDVIRVSEALDALLGVDERLVHVVEMKFFAGLNEEEIAQALGITDRTVRRAWKKAKLLLFEALR